jgi:acetyltransferase-like isoleucine patch superfamily enzyme
VKLSLFENFRFADIRKDKWRASEDRLTKREMGCLKQRELVYLFYRMIRFTVLFPVSVVRCFVSIVRVLDEFERLHFSPLRRVKRGVDCVIDRQTWLVNGQNITMGGFVKLSAFSSVMAGYVSTIKIGSNTIIGPGVIIVSFNHGMKINGVPIRYQEWQDSAENSIIIGDDVWIGGNVVVLPGTNIGNGSIIGAGAVIKGVIPPGTIAYSKNGLLKTVPRV